MWMCHFRAQNGPFAFNNFFLVQTIVVFLIYLLVLFIVQNFKKFLQQIQSYDNASFLCPKWTICPQTMFFLENYYYHCHLPISPFHCANLKKKFVQRIQSSQNVQSLGPKPPISANENFFQKTC